MGPAGSIGSIGKVLEESLGVSRPIAVVSQCRRVELRASVLGAPPQVAHTP